ncbi:BTB/POZ domain containing protein [Tritrichomonas foetus]|uniref:BTB/POZ domain containing protein n=1 Tax=Tritrichomonas foetus TaxID=1144522 RepID=A0A1J4JSK0_9EUKA|nr:BTB/POZ domain containing protein [Tritrichomonas foetus]|eukprot:OHT02081.1 BTB/POZ domain containing protein [Tritrichomonas foetus]
MVILTSYHKSQGNYFQFYCGRQNMKKQNNFHVRTHYYPIYDFSNFCCDDQKLADCQLILPSGEIIKAHILLLANSSEFFYNAFTSGMTEQVKREVNIKVNPMNLFPKVIQWIYSSQIQVEENEIMSLFSIARVYGINSLYNLLEEKIKQKINPNNIYDYINQCYDNELTSELLFLTQYIAYFLPQLNLQSLSDNLDVPTFCQVLEKCEIEPEKKMTTLTTFLGNYQCTESDMEAIVQLFDPKNPLTRAAYKKLKPSWAPPGSF